MSENRFDTVRELVKDPSLRVTEIAWKTGYNKGHVSRLRKEAIRQALETEQKPVAWMFVNEDGECEQIEYGPVFDDPGVTPLYTAPPKRELTCVCGAVWEGETMVHPPRKREWVGLTDDEIQDLGYLSEKFDASNSEWFDRWGFARAIEAKLKEKNQ